MRSSRDSTSADPQRARSGRIGRFLRRARRDRRGTVAMLFGLSVIPMVGAVSAGVEYWRGLTYQTRLDAAADAAAIAAVNTARDYLAANTNSATDQTTNAVNAGVAKGAAVFRANAGATLNLVPATPTITVTRSGQTMNGVVRYASNYATVFGRIFGISQIAVAGRADASLTMGSYTDFYLLLDTSGSMGFPTSTAQQDSFAKLNPDMRDSKGNNCAFACHFPGWQGYALAKANNIELRIKTVGNAVQQLIATANNSATLANQFRVGLYPFVSFMETAADATTSLSSLSAVAANLENYMDVGDSSVPRGSGGTHYDTLLTAIDAKITRRGDGSSSAKAKPFIFLITDGIGNNQYWYNSTGWTGSQSYQLNPSLCDPLKNGGVVISILYIPYMPLSRPFNENVGYENVRVNALIPNVPSTLQACASPGYFRTASSADEITAALNTMFAQATAVTRLTH